MIESCLHDETIESVALSSQSKPIPIRISSTNGCRFTVISGLRLMKQNVATGSRYAKMAQEGHRVTWMMPVEAQDKGCWGVIVDSVIVRPWRSEAVRLADDPVAEDPQPTTTTSTTATAAATAISKKRPRVVEPIEEVAEVSRWRMDRADLFVPEDQDPVPRCSGVVGGQPVVVEGFEFDGPADDDDDDHVGGTADSSRKAAFEVLAGVLDAMARVPPHRNLGRLLGAVVDGQDPVLLAWEAGEPLASSLGASAQLPLQKKVHLLIEVFSAVAHLHSHRIVHCCIRPDNILFAEGGQARLIGATTPFGRRARLELDRHDVDALVWLAPEQIRTSGSTQQDRPHLDGPECDLYSLGVLIWAVFAGRRPYPAITSALMALRKIVVGDQERPEFTAEMQTPQWLQDLAQDCWHRDPESRPSVHEALARLRAG
jgi:hypothetical protein